MTTKVKEKIECQNCRYFSMADSVWGYCKRFPQREIMIKWFPKPKYKMAYPEVSYDDWCGEGRLPPPIKRINKNDYKNNRPN